MLKKIFKRCLAVLLCICVFCGSFVITVFSTDIGSAMDIADFIEYLYDNLGMITFQSGVQIIDGAVSLAQRSKVLVFWRDAVKKYNVSESNFRTMFDIVWQADINTFISKYGDEVYNKCFDTLQDEVKITCRVYSGGLDEICDLIYRSDTNDYKLTDDNDVQVPVPALKDHIQTVNKLYYPKNASGIMSYRTDDRFHNLYDSMSLEYFALDFYAGDFGFSATGGKKEMYFVFFEKLGDSSFYGQYQFHCTITAEDIPYEDRDEVQYTNYTLSFECWDNIDGSQSEPISLASITKTSPYFVLCLNSSRAEIYSYSSYSNYISNKSPSWNTVCTDNNLIRSLWKPDLSSSIYFNYSHQQHFKGSLSSHDSSCSYNGSCDFGFLASSAPISTLYNIDTTKIPDNYYVTISNDSSTGDTIYNYTLVNPETGQKDTIQNYITNNYTFTTNNEGDTNISGGNGSGGSLGGDVTVGGNVEVGGKVDIGGQVDINVNVNGGNNDNVSFPDTDLVENLPEAPQGFIDYLKKLFDFLPAPVLAIIIAAIAAAVFCRIWGR